MSKKNSEKVIFSIDKSEKSKDKIYFREVTYKDKDYVDLRFYYLNKDDEYVPSQKGMMLTHDKFEEVLSKLKQYNNGEISGDNAESEKEIAYLINDIAVKNVAEVCSDNNISLIHYSTDFVFDGESRQPYLENDKTNPINVYGKSKLAGERSISYQEKLNYLIIRTSWVYAEHGNNFVKTMLQLFDSKEELGVVNDQVGAPTYAEDIAECTLSLIEKDMINDQVLHFSNKGKISWYDFASEIKNLTSSNIKINAITTNDYPTPAKRPKFSVMDLSRSMYLGINIKDWKESLRNCINKI